MRRAVFASSSLISLRRSLSTNMALTLNKVLISDEVDPACVDVLKQNGIVVDKNTKLTKDQLIAEIKNYDGLIVRSATKVTADVIAAAKKLQIIGRAGTGVDNIDCDAATKHGVIVMNTPGGNTMSAAEHTCALLMAVSRHISNGTESLRAGRWDRKKFMGNEVFGKTLGIIGLGRIGQEVATRMQSFGMTTIGFDPIVSAEDAAAFNTEWLPLEQIWPRVDYITVHTPLIPQTKNLINDDVFSKCKKGVRVVNCARGGIIDEEALLKALNDGRCAGAGLDVFIEEPPTNNDLINHPLVTSTPHLGASTVEAQSRVAVEIAEQFVDAARGKSLFGAINAQALSNALSPETKPYVQLGRALGVLAARLAGGVNKATQVQVITQGSCLTKAGSYLSASALVGLLKSETSNGLNLISAPALAKDIGVQVTSSHQDGLSNQVTVVVEQPGSPARRVTGRVAGDQPQLVDIDGASFQQAPALQGNLVVYRGQANPQVLPSVIGALGSANAGVQSYAGSSSIDGQSWNLLSVEPRLASLDILKSHVDFLVQVEV